MANFNTDLIIELLISATLYNHTFPCSVKCCDVFHLFNETVMRKMEIVLSRPMHPRYVNHEAPPGIASRTQQDKGHRHGYQKKRAFARKCKG